MDITMFFYITTAFLSILGSCIFLYHWFQLGHASWAFKYMTFFLISIGYRSVIDAMARNLSCSSMEEFSVFSHSTLWSTRLIPLSFVLLVFNVHILSRILNSKRLNE